MAAVVCAGLCGAELGTERLWLTNGTYSCEQRLATGQCGVGYWTNGRWCSTLEDASTWAAVKGDAIYAVVDGQIGEQLAAVAVAA